MSSKAGKLMGIASAFLQAGCPSVTQSTLSRSEGLERIHSFRL